MVIDALLPLFNEPDPEGVLSDAVTSAPPGVGLVVVDDGSDPPLELPVGFGRARVVRIDRTVGRQAALMRAARESRADVVVCVPAPHADRMWDLERRRVRSGADVAVSTVTDGAPHGRWTLACGRTDAVRTLLASRSGDDLDVIAARHGFSLER